MFQSSIKETVLKIILIVDVQWTTWTGDDLL